MNKILAGALLPLAFLLSSCGDATGPELPTYIMWGGFESGTMLTSQTPAGDWDQLVEVNGAMYMSGQSHTGDWAVEAAVSDSCSAPAWGAYLKKDFVYSGSTLYARTWFMLQSGHNLLEEDGRSFGFLRLGDTQMEEICSFRVGNYGGEPVLAIHYVRDDPGGPVEVLQDIGFAIDEDAWYYLEVAVVLDDSTGSFSAWMSSGGGSPEHVQVADIDTDTGIQLESFCVGIVDNGGYAEGSMFFDDYGLAEARIGAD